MNTFKVKVTNPETNTVTEVPIVEFVPKEGRGAGRPKLYPENLDLLDLDYWVNAFGKKVIYNNILGPALRQRLNGFSAEALTKLNGEPEEDEKTIIEDFSEMFKTLSKRGETISSINDRLDEILNNENGLLVAAIMTGKSDLARQLSEEVRSLNEAKAAKKAQRTTHTLIVA